MKVRKVLLMSDLHIPYHDTKAVTLALKVADHVQPDQIIIVGDGIDFHGLSRFTKDPGVEEMLVDEISEMREFLASLRKRFPKTELIYILGNHENRLVKYIQEQAPALYGVVTFRQLLDLDTLHIKDVPYGPDQMYKIPGCDLLVRHENITGGVHSAHATVTKAMRSVVFGHTHRIQESQIVSIDDHNHRGINIGCLCDKHSPVMSYVKNHWQWALGFGVATIMPNGHWFHQVVHIIDYTCLVDGKIFKA
jgi:predicted phosphodiesterase